MPRLYAVPTLRKRLRAYSGLNCVGGCGDSVARTHYVSLFKRAFAVGDIVLRHGLVATEICAFKHTVGGDKL